MTAQLYGGVTAIDERHRHRYEINIDYVKKLEEKGLEFVGRDTTGERMEVFELADHPYFVGCQAGRAPPRLLLFPTRTEGMQRVSSSH